MVATETGMRPIEEIVAGDRVVARALGTRVFHDQIFSVLKGWFQESKNDRADIQKKAGALVPLLHRG